VLAMLATKMRPEAEERLTVAAEGEDEVMSTVIPVGHRRRRRWTRMELVLTSVVLAAVSVAVVLLATILVTMLVKDSSDPPLSGTTTHVAPSSTQNPLDRLFSTANVDEEVEDEEALAMAAAAAAIWQRRVDAVNKDFGGRYPRHSRRYAASPSAARLVTRRRLPAGLMLARSPPSSPELRVHEVLFALDTDADGAADPWELFYWMERLQNIVYRHYFLL
jgi:hypothetical protein